DKFRSRTAVEHARRRDDDVWDVELEGGDTRQYDEVAVSNGHHCHPRWLHPPFPGHFDGTEMHSHYYTDPEELHGKRVVIIGMGNSAMDIAVDASYVSEEVYLAARRGASIIPKYIPGQPLDPPRPHGTLHPR